MDEKIPIVNEKDEVIAVKNRSEIDYQNDIYRVTPIWMTNNEGDILMAQRSFKKDKSPGKWGPAAAGTVNEHETYLENALKELSEEIGVIMTPQDVEEGPKLFMRQSNPSRHYFCQWYFLQLDQPEDQFVIQEDEVEKVKWFTEAELREAIQTNSNDFMSNTEKYFTLFTNSDN